MGIFSRSSGQESAASSSSSLPLPPGRSRAIPLLGQTLSFHDAAHDEVTFLVQNTGSSSVRLNVIARNVALVTAYKDAALVLKQGWEEPPSVSRLKAYDQLMSAFYSSPNLLLEDENHQGAREHREYWNESIEQAMQRDDVRSRTAGITMRWMERIAAKNESIEDLYDTCKDLGHDLALGTFLSLDDKGGLSGESDSHDRLRGWSEEMLRGQFTLPVGINVGFFQNAFSRGQAAKVKFDNAVEEQLSTNQQQCPFAVNPNGKLSTSSLISHHAMFASSLVVKGFASLATALLLQLFRGGEEGTTTLANRLCNSDDESFRLLLDSIITETERLSPPIIGVMRRVTKEGGIDLPASSNNVPAGWDVWPYFPLANRDESVFGQDAYLFKSDRYSAETDTPQPLSFGAGVKDCLGHGVVRVWLYGLASTYLGRGTSTRAAYNLQFDEEEIDNGVKSFLGWLSSSDQSASWQGVKQLPIQRPRKAIAVRLVTPPMG